VVLCRTVVPTSVRHLRPNARNVRRHPKQQIRQIANSIQRFGWTVPILVDEKGRILAGHGRYDAALQLGLKEVPVIVISGLNEAEKRALALGDNKIAANASWDRGVLASELGELCKVLPEYDLNIEITGFDLAEINSLKSKLVAAEQDQADESPEVINEPVSRTGDMWLLGGHRLICGDATDPAHGGKLRNPKRALLGIDAAVRCWQRFTKNDAILAGTNRTFDDVAAARSKRARRKT
jgi:hypothetical protein